MQLAIAKINSEKRCQAHLFDESAKPIDSTGSSTESWCQVCGIAILGHCDCEPLPRRSTRLVNRNIQCTRPDSTSIASVTPVFNIKMTQKKQILITGVAFGLVACFLTWLLMTGTSSPLQNYLLHHPWSRNLWGEMIFPVLAVGMIFGLPQSDFIGYPLVFIQWFIVGSAVAMALGGIKRTFASTSDRR